MTQKRRGRASISVFKSQLVKLFEYGKPRADIILKYDLSASANNKGLK